ncbi:MAG: hypothetical protein GY805_34850, partial [Chloroflexi bacterium]|nr:hypothetical protein [Chloroflexota bacterium]
AFLLCCCWHPAKPLLAAAGLDRLAHHAEFLVIQGDSFRARGRQWLEEEVKIEIAK